MAENLTLSGHSSAVKAGQPGGAQSPSGGGSVSQANSLERQMLELINAERAKVGVAPLSLELKLNEAAEGHTEWMLSVDTFSHTGIGGSSPGTRMSNAGFDFSGSWGWAENIAGRTISSPSGYADEVIGLHTQLMNSTGHRNNILNPSLEYIGIGIEIGEYKGNMWAMVTQTFARTDGSVDLDSGMGSTAPQSNQPSSGDDVLVGTNGNDVIAGLAGNDAISGGGGNDLLIGGPGADRLDGGSGVDEADYESATSSVQADLANTATNAGDAEGDSYVAVENLRGSSFGDVLAGNGGANYLLGGHGDDQLFGRGGDDMLDGGTGNDTISGGTGNDTIIGGKGHDLASGDAGADVFRFAIGDDTLTISDFEPGVDDLALLNLGVGFTVRDLLPYVSQEGSDVVIRSGSQEVRFEDTQLSELSAGDVIFV
jgi:Ca2+-binding RTX toxin-like protein